MLELKLKSDRRSALKRQEGEVLANENAHHSRAEEEHKKQIVRNFAIRILNHFYNRPLKIVAHMDHRPEFSLSIDTEIMEIRKTEMGNFHLTDVVAVEAGRNGLLSGIVVNPESAPLPFYCSHESHSLAKVLSLYRFKSFFYFEYLNHLSTLLPTLVRKYSQLKA